VTLRRTAAAVLALAALASAGEWLYGVARDLRDCRAAREALAAEVGPACGEAAQRAERDYLAAMNEAHAVRNSWLDYIGEGNLPGLRTRAAVMLEYQTRHIEALEAERRALLGCRNAVRRAVAPEGRP